MGTPVGKLQGGTRTGTVHRPTGRTAGDGRGEPERGSVSLGSLTELCSEASPHLASPGRDAGFLCAVAVTQARAPGPLPFPYGPSPRDGHFHRLWACCTSGLDTDKTAVDTDWLNSLTNSQRRGPDPNMPMRRGRQMEVDGQGAGRFLPSSQQIGGHSLSGCHCHKTLPRPLPQPLLPRATLKRHLE